VSEEYASNDIGYCSDCGAGLFGLRYGAGARQCWTCRQGGADVVEVPQSGAACRRTLQALLDRSDLALDPARKDDRCRTCGNRP